MKCKNIIEIEKELRKGKQEKTGIKGSLLSRLPDPGQKDPLLSRPGVLGWETGTTRVSLPGQISISVVVTVTVFRDVKAIPVPSSNLPQHLGQLLESHSGADVTFAVSGESFAAHKSILAARSPVFRAEFFGEIFFSKMQENCASLY